MAHFVKGSQKRLAVTRKWRRFTRWDSKPRDMNGRGEVFCTVYTLGPFMFSTGPHKVC